MTKTDQDRRPAALWKSMTETQRRRAAEAFWADEDSIAEQTEVQLLLARKLNFRYKSVDTMSGDRKATHLMKLGNVSEGVAARLLVAYHLAAQRPMMGAFLDALGIAHENGLIAEEEAPKPEAARIAEAATALSAAYPAEEVRLYFETLLVQDPDTWGALSAHVPA